MKMISILKYAFPIIGLAMLAGAFYSYSSTQQFLSSALTTDGKVIELIRSRSQDSVTYRPVVQFVARDGSNIEFSSNSGSNPPSYSRGQTVEVLYREDAPEKAKINSFFSLWGLPVILGSLGAVFVLIGSSMFLFGRLKKNKIEGLKQNGRAIMVAFQSVDRNTGLKVNGKSPYQIITQWQNPATAEIHIFKSDNIWFDPTDYIDGDEITVLVDHNNLKKYHMDISFLPQLAD